MKQEKLGPGEPEGTTYVARRPACCMANPRTESSGKEEKMGLNGLGLKRMFWD